MICFELLEIARPDEIESELLFHFVIILGVISEDTGHWRSLSNILGNHNRNIRIDMNRDRPGCGGTRRDRRVIRVACDGTLTSRSWRSLHGCVYLNWKTQTTQVSHQDGRTKTRLEPLVTQRRWERTAKKSKWLTEVKQHERQNHRQLQAKPQSPLQAKPRKD